jgi:hypothetical protein
MPLGGRRVRVRMLGVAFAARTLARGPVERHVERAVLRAHDRERSGPQLFRQAIERVELALAREIGPVRDEHVRGGDLLAQQRERVGLGKLARIHDHHHGRERERLRVRAAADRVDQVLRSRKPGRLDDQAIGRLREHGAQRVDEALGRRAAHAAARDVGDAERLALGEHGFVEARVAEVVHDHGDLLARAPRELVPDRRGLPRAEKAGEDLDRDRH